MSRPLPDRASVCLKKALVSCDSFNAGLGGFFGVSHVGRVGCRVARILFQSQAFG